MFFISHRGNINGIDKNSESNDLAPTKLPISPSDIPKDSFAKIGMRRTKISINAMLNMPNA